MRMRFKDNESNRNSAYNRPNRLIPGKVYTVTPYTQAGDIEPYFKVVREDGQVDTTYASRWEEEVVINGWEIP